MATAMRPRYWQGTNMPPLGWVPDPEHPDNVGLVGCWIMNAGGGAVVMDLTKHENHAMRYNGSPLWSASTTDIGLRTTTSSDCFRVNSHPVFCPTTALTVCIDWTVPAARPDAGLLKKSYSIVSYQMRCLSGHSFRWQTTAGALDWPYSYTIMDTYLGKRIYLVGTFDGASMRMFVDGILRKTVSASTSTISQNTEALDIVGQQYGTQTGYVAHSVTIYDQALSADDIAARAPSIYRSFMLPGAVRVFSFGGGTVSVPLPVLMSSRRRSA